MERGPYLNTAVFCDMTLLGNDGTLSIIRIVDTVTQTATGPEPPPQMPAFVLKTKLAVVLKAGDARGRFGLKITGEAPDGRQLPTQEHAIHLDGDHHGINLIVDVTLAVDLEGLYWFDLFFVAAPDDERLLTRVPLRVLYQPQRTAAPPNSD
jgi:hypothetical protein